MKRTSWRCASHTMQVGLSVSGPRCGAGEAEGSQEQGVMLWAASGLPMLMFPWTLFTPVNPSRGPAAPQACPAQWRGQRPCWRFGSPGGASAGCCRLSCPRTRRASSACGCCGDGLGLCPLSAAWRRTSRCCAPLPTCSAGCGSQAALRGSLLLHVVRAREIGSSWMDQAHTSN